MSLSLATMRSHARSSENLFHMTSRQCARHFWKVMPCAWEHAESNEIEGNPEVTLERSLTCSIHIPRRRSTMAPSSKSWRVRADWFSVQTWSMAPWRTLMALYFVTGRTGSDYRVDYVRPRVRMGINGYERTCPQVIEKNLSYRTLPTNPFPFLAFRICSPEKTVAECRSVCNCQAD